MNSLTAAGSTRRWRRLRLLVLERDGYRCQLPVHGGTAGHGGRACGAHASHVDHVVPRKLGGTDAPGNLRAACQSCNLRRGARPELATPPAPTTPTRRWSW